MAKFGNSDQNIQEMKFVCFAFWDREDNAQKLVLAARDL